jgi:hypothetical protein
MDKQLLLWDYFNLPNTKMVEHQIKISKNNEEKIGIQIYGYG